MACKLAEKAVKASSMCLPPRFSGGCQPQGSSGTPSIRHDFLALCPAPGCVATMTKAREQSGSPTSIHHLQRGHQYEKVDSGTMTTSKCRQTSILDSATRQLGKTLLLASRRARCHHFESCCAVLKVVATLLTTLIAKAWGSQADNCPVSAARLLMP